ncbi:MAG: ATP-binding protein [Planctomycetia bacterium]|nr:ATP-binding protein [Planctomycetia bacterium]
MTFSFDHDYGQRIYRGKRIPCEFHWEMTIAQAGPDQIATIVGESAEIKGRDGQTEVRFFSLEVDRSGDKARVKPQLCSPNEFGRDLFSIWDIEYRSKKKGVIAEQFNEKTFFQDASGRLKKDPDHSCFPVVAQLDEVLNEIYSNFMFLNEYNILPDVARAATEQLPFAQMAPNGEGVSEVIDALENKRYDKLEQLRFMDFDGVFGSAPYHSRYHSYRLFTRFGFRARRWPDKREPYSGALDDINRQLSAAVRPITAVSVEIDPTSGKRFVVFKANMDKFYPQEVSDGTVKWLCILVSLFVPFSRVYLIEEPENFLHPWMQQRLIEIMREQAKQNKTIFLLSSHSATVLNAALPQEVLIVKQSEDGTMLTAMNNIEDIRRVLTESEFHLGDLWVSGAIGGVPSDE